VAAAAAASAEVPSTQIPWVSPVVIASDEKTTEAKVFSAASPR